MPHFKDILSSVNPLPSPVNSSMKQEKKSTTISSCISMIERKVTGKHINITFFSTFSLPLSLHPPSFLCAIQEADAEK